MPTEPRGLAQSPRKATALTLDWCDANDLEYSDV